LLSLSTSYGASDRDGPRSGGGGFNETRPATLAVRLLLVLSGSLN